MKKVLCVAALIALTFSSCMNDGLEVVTKNGSVIKAYDNEDRNFTMGQKVCIERINARGNWKVVNDGSMEDTTYWVSLDSTGFLVEYKIGLIK